MKKPSAIALLLLLLSTHAAHGQGRSRLSNQSHCKDSSSIGGVIDSYYRLVSGPAGKRDWDAFNALFLPTARLDAVGINAQGSNQFFPQSRDEYVHHLGEYLQDRGFFQKELKRTIRCYASIAHVLSTYESRNEPGGKVIDRGVMSFQLIHDKEGWKIAHMMWNSETKEYPVPREHLR